jgi:hypothetical protein
VRGDDALIGTEVVVPAGTMLFRQVPLWRLVHLAEVGE